MASIDTHVIRLHGVNEINTGDLDIMAQQNAGITPFVVPEHQALYNAMMKYKGKHFTMNRIFKRNRSEYTVLNDEDYLHQLSLNRHDIQYDYMEFRDGSDSKTIELPTRGSVSLDERKFSELTSLEKETYLENGGFGNFRTSSSISHIQFKLNPNARYLEFEFSIPKYLYGHNLAQFIPQGNSDFLFEQGRKDNFSHWNVQKKYLYERYMSFLNQFFTDLCVRFKLEVMPNMDYIEIRRIDLCYNQYFDTREKALIALKEKKKLNSKKHRQNQKNINDNGYETSLIYRSASGSYFKIYHKGSEYINAKGDLSKHLKINKTFLENKFKSMQPSEQDLLSFKDLYYDNKGLLERVFGDHTKGKAISIDENKKENLSILFKKVKPVLPYDTHFLKTEMDKILRYEVSLSSPFFKYHYKRKIFRKKDVPHNEALQTYKKVKSIYDKRNDSFDVKVDKWEHDLHKKMHAYFNRTVCLVLSNSKKLQAFERESYNKRYQLFDYDPTSKKYSIGRILYKKTKLSEKDIGLFSNDLLKSCVDHFKTLVSYFNVHSIEPVQDISSKIAQYNEKVKERFENYNRNHHHMVYDFRGKHKIKGNRVITKAYLLLTEKERYKEGIQKINPAPLIGILNYLEKGGSMQEYFKQHKISSSSRSRYKMQLERFNIFDTTIMNQEPILEKYDYSDYYDLTSNFQYRKKFYFKQEHYLLS